jgi:hypothetical protein
MTTTHTLYDMYAPKRIMKFEIFEQTETVMAHIKATYSHDIYSSNPPDNECLRVYEQSTQIMVFYAGPTSAQLVSLEWGRRLWDALISQGWKVKS